MNTLVLNLKTERESWFERQELSQVKIERERQVFCMEVPAKRWQSGKLKTDRLACQIGKVAKKRGIAYAALGDALEGNSLAMEALAQSGLSVCGGKTLHMPLYPSAVRKLAKEAGIGLMERPVTIAGGETDIVDLIVRMKDEVRFFAVAGGQQYADLITYLYDEFGISVRLVEEAHSGICIAAGGEQERLSGSLVLDFGSSAAERIGVRLDMGDWNDVLYSLSGGSNLGAVEALLRTIGEEPKEGLEKYCRKVSLIRKKPCPILTEKTD